MSELLRVSIAVVLLPTCLLSIYLSIIQLSLSIYHLLLLLLESISICHLHLSIHQSSIYLLSNYLYLLSIYLLIIYLYLLSISTGTEIVNNYSKAVPSLGSGTSSTTTTPTPYVYKYVCTQKLPLLSFLYPLSFLLFVTLFRGSRR